MVSIRKVFLLQGILPNYRVRFITDLASDPRLNLGVLYSHPSQSESKDGFRNGSLSTEISQYEIPSPQDKPFSFLLHLLELIWQERPEIVITGYWHISIYLLVLFKKFFGFRLVLWHGGFPFKNGEALSTHVERIKKSRFPNFLHHCDSLIVYSEHAARTFENYFDVESTKINVAPNAPDTDLFFKLKASEEVGNAALRSRFSPNGEKILVTIGRLTKARKLDLLLDVISLMKSEGRRISLVVIGSGPEGQKLVSEVRKRGLQNVYFEGEIFDDHQIGCYLAASDIYVYTGVASLAVKIAMSMGLPTVGFDYGLEVHNIEDGVTGYVIPFGDTRAMAIKLGYLVDHDDVRSAMGKEGHSLMVTKINTETMVSGFLESIFPN